MAVLTTPILQLEPHAMLKPAVGNHDVIRGQLEVQVDQTLFNIVLSVAGLLGGWWLKVMWGAIKDLQKSDEKIIDRISSIEILVAGKYVTRDEFSQQMTNVDNKLDRIMDNLNGKADRRRSQYDQ